MAPGPEIGSGCETPQPLVPTRVAGRCGLRWCRKGATALSRTFFVPRSPCVPAAPAFPKPRRKPGSQAATGPLRGADGAGMPPSGERPHKRPHRGKRRGTGWEGLSALPLPVHIAVSGLSFWTISSVWLLASWSAIFCCGDRNRISQTRDMPCLERSPPALAATT